MFRFFALIGLTFYGVALFAGGCSASRSAALNKNNIVETAAAAGSFTILTKALDAAALKDALQGDGPFTVFAPTDEAFAKLPAGTLDELLKPENRQKLVDILTYHVVKGRIPAADVVGVDKAITLNGQSVTVNVQGQAVRINGSNVIKTDIDASNGIIHVIDEVLLPAS